MFHHLLVYRIYLVTSLSVSFHKSTLSTYLHLPMCFIFLGTFFSFVIFPSVVSLISPSPPYFICITYPNVFISLSFVIFSIVVYLNFLSFSCYIHLLLFHLYNLSKRVVYLSFVLFLSVVYLISQSFSLL